MHFSMGLATLALVASSHCTQLFYESITGQNLLGSHFGIPPVPATYDYLVIGGGTAGLTLARRLAANASYTVAVVEAGGFYEFDNGNASTIPADAGDGWGWDPENINPLTDWQQYTTPQAGLKGRVSLYAQGKTFGGGSARNGMWYQRSAKGAYQKWANEVGDDSYSFKNFAPFYERSINFTPPTHFPRPANATVSYDAKAFSATGGPLHVSYGSWAFALSSWIAKSMKSLGFKQVPGFTSGDLLGYSYISFTIDPTSGTRSSSETSFLREALMQTTNLNFYKQTLAKQIIFNNQTEAVGVVVETAGKLYNITANKEVIISSGVFRSPQLLMVSGIGPAALLESKGVHVLADRPGVGQNMWDHVLFGPSYEVDVVTDGTLGQVAFATEQFEMYSANHTGILATGGGDFVAFEKVPADSVDKATEAALTSQFSSDWPAIEYLPIQGYAGTLKDLTGSPPPSIGGNYAAIVAALVAPFSRGNVSISSSDTADNPLISPNWLEDPRDQQVAIAAYKRAREIFTSKVMKPVLIGGEVFPGTKYSTDAQILAQIQAYALPVYHAAATCAMGRINDSMAVVDAKARVIGVKGLRVVDASAFPFLPPGHPQGTVYALAEKIAEDILEGK